MLTILIHYQLQFQLIYGLVSSEIPSPCSNHTEPSFIQSSPGHHSRSTSVSHSPTHVPCSPINLPNSSSPVTMSHSSHVSPSPHVSHSPHLSNNLINSPRMSTSNISANTSSSSQTISTCPIPPILALHRP